MQPELCERLGQIDKSFSQKHETVSKDSNKHEFKFYVKIVFEGYFGHLEMGSVKKRLRMNILPVADRLLAISV